MNLFPKALLHRAQGVGDAKEQMDEDMPEQVNLG
jgi:hypothetical protein